MNSIDSILTGILVPEILNTLTQVDLASSKIYLGVSGGLDSLALFYAWSVVRDKKGIPFSVIHVEHGLRGQESQNDGNYVKKLCMEKKVAFYLVAVDVQDEMKKRNIGGLEEAARIMRYEAFESVLKTEKSPYLYLAHHQEDQAETVMMNVLRGTGLKGLGGIPTYRQWKNITLMRPFLGLSKTQLKEALLEKGLTWREDESNTQNIGLRNKLRNDIMPLLYEEYPQLSSSIYRMTQVVTAEEVYWTEKVKSWCDKKGYFSKNICFIDYQAFIKEPLALQRRLFRFAFEEAMEKYNTTPNHGMVYLNYKQTDDGLNFLFNQKGEKFNLPQHLFAEKSGNRLYFLRENKLLPFVSINISAPFTYDSVQAGEWCFTFSSVNKAHIKALPSYGDHQSYQVGDLRKYAHLTLRTRKAGDFITPLGSTGKIAVKKFLINKKVDRPLRDQLPLLVHGENEVLWIPNYGISSEIAVTEGTNHGILIKYAYPYQM